MLSFRPKLGTERSSEYLCCFCLHVRTGTIILGSWHLILHLIALGFLAAVVRDPSLLEDLERDSSPVAEWSDIGPPMPTPLSNVETRPTPYPQHSFNIHDHRLGDHDVDVGALVTVCTLAVTLMLIYGAARGKPAHLLPFFCLLIFNFAITVLTATGYLCYLRTIHQLVRETRLVPWREDLLSLPAPVLALIVFAALMFDVLLKGYCISVIWRCYKYLTMRSHSVHNLTPFVISNEGAVTPAYPAPDYSSLLPDYEEAVKQTPPPSYRVATLMADNNTASSPPLPPLAPQTPASTTNTVVMLPQPGSQARV